MLWCSYNPVLAFLIQYLVIGMTQIIFAYINVYTIVEILCYQKINQLLAFLTFKYDIFTIQFQENTS